MNSRARTSCLLSILGLCLALAGLPLAEIDLDALRLFDSDVPVAFRFEAANTGHELPSAPTLNAKNAGGAKAGSCDRLRERSSDHGLIRDLLRLAPVKPGSGSKLDFCPEFTKPGSLVIGSRGTPKNHRSPPA